ncbi:MAG TPA: nuclease-related domain-containing protein [Streptosporangiaceae bacterium]|nr:nuclease-related domain-containing protein [Streptosporangiaceae bacterium]
MPVTRTRTWERYGQLRIYVSAGDDELGWCDPRTGRFQLTRPAMAAVFWSAIRDECQRLFREGRLAEALLPGSSGVIPPSAGPGAGPPSASPGAGTSSTSPGPGPDAGAGSWRGREPGWDDLASNVPGAAARAHAKELRAAHPLLVTAAKAVGFRTAAASFAAGARGERLVGRKLNRWAARHGWHVLHAVPVGRAGTDIDHVVIAAFGVVTVNTKATRTSVWVGEYGMMVGRTRVDYLRKSQAEGRRAQRLLTRAAQMDVPVQPVIVFVGARRFSVRRGGPVTVAVLASPRALHRWLRKQPAVLTDAQVNALYDVARQPATWQGQGRGPAAPPFGPAPQR